MIRRLLIVAALLTSLPLQARVEVAQFEDPQQEQRYRRLINELRCLVCQNQNLADSNAELAQDLRRKTYDMIRSGASDVEIINYMVARYGEFVLYRPPLSSSTALLWIGPFILLATGVAVLVVVIRRRSRVRESIDQAERERLKALLEQDHRPVD